MSSTVSFHKEPQSEGSESPTVYTTQTHTGRVLCVPSTGYNYRVIVVAVVVVVAAVVVAVVVVAVVVLVVEAKLIARSCEVGRAPAVLKALPPCGTHSIKPNRLIWVNVNSLITHSVIEGCNINSTVSHGEGEGAGLLMGPFCKLRAVKIQQDSTTSRMAFASQYRALHRKRTEEDPESPVV